jgi:hypothetical protein
MRTREIAPAQLVNGETHVSGRRRIRNVGDAGDDVVIVEDAADQRVDTVHALIRMTTPSMGPEAACSDPRNTILDQVEYFGSPPSPPQSGIVADITTEPPPPRRVGLVLVLPCARHGRTTSAKKQTARGVAAHSFCGER